MLIHNDYKNRGLSRSNVRFMPKFECRAFVGSILTLILGALCLWSGSLLAATGDLTFIEKHNDGGGVSGLNGARQVNISPDGKHVYVVSIVDTSNNGAVAVFSRDEITGQLTFVESHVKNHPGMRGVQDVDVSPNGEFVYLGSITDQAVVVFSRDVSSGALTFIESVNTPAPGYGGAQNITSLDITDDGLHMYSSGAGRITQWSVDAITGSVVPVAGIQDGSLFPTSDRVRLTPDGKHLYMSDINGDAVLGFERDTTTGALTYIQTFDHGVDGAKLDSVTDLAVSPDGAFVYASARSDKVVTVFSRDPVTGLLSFVSETGGVSSVRHFSMSQDGSFLFASDEGFHAVHAFSRNSVTGAVTLVDTEKDGVNGVDGLRTAHGVVTSPDGLHVYVSARVDDALTVFGVEAPVPNLAPDCTLAAIPDQIADAACQAVISGSDVTGIADPENDALTVSVSPTTLSVGANLVTVTADDGNGNTCSIDVTVNVNDTTPPVAIAQDITIQLDSGTASISGLDIDNGSNDVCSGVVLSVSQASFTSADLGPNNVTLTVTDSSGNTSTASSTVTVEEVPVEEKIYWIEAAEIFSVNKDGSGDVLQIVGGLSTGFSIAVDETAGKLYWTDRTTNKISRSDIDGSNVEDLYTFASDRPFTLALDVAAGDLYFSSPDSNTINRAKMDGSAAPVVIYDSSDASAAPDNGNSGNPGIRDVRGIALDLAAGMIYWTDRGTGADRVVRGTIDGTMTPQLLYTQGSGSAQMVALDIDAEMLYWTNSGRNQIERGKMDGSGSRESLYVSSSGAGGGIAGLALDVPNGDLYWTSTSSDDIRRGKLDGPNAVDGTAVVIRSGLANPWALVVVGASLQVADEAPTITLSGADPYDVECGVAYVDPGAIAIDDLDGNISGSIVVDSSNVDASALGSYSVTYDVTDSGGNAAVQLTRTVNVVDTTAPVITLSGDNPHVIECPNPYVELGVSAVDTCDQALGAVVIDVSSVDVSTPGNYFVTYNISDASGNAAIEVTRTVSVVDTTSPVIVLVGDSPQVIECLNPYVEFGATAIDDCDQGLGAVLIDASAVNVATPGSYLVTYNISDASGNAAIEVARTVSVIDTTAPVIVLVGDNPQVIECPSPYVELGATASDACDTALGAIVIDASAIDTATPGSYLVTYNISDASGNAAVTVTRTVTFTDNTAPLLTLNGDSVVALECSIDAYNEQGATVSDDCDPNVTVVVGGDTVDSMTNGVYTVTYDAVDATGNVAVQLTRTVTVGDATAPVISLAGAPPVGGGGAAGELTFIATYKNGQNGISGLDGAEKPIVSPDGKNVYAIALKGDSNNTGFLLAFSRDEVTGELTYLETESGHPGINGPKHVIVSPNGKWVYICTLKDQSVLTFSRDATDGRLTYLDTIDVGRNMTYIDTTPDGENLYAVSSRHVERLTIDTVTGIPTWIERVQPPSSSAGDKLTVSDDGKFLYWGDINANRVYVFSIDVSTGGLTHLQTFNNGDSGSLINGVTDLKISPDGLFLYIAATRDDYLTVFSRDITTGLITFASDIASPNGAVRSLAISPDGATLIAADQSNSIRSYARDFTTGALTLIEEERDGVNGVDGLDRSLGVDISPDGSHVYVTARDDDAVTFFELEPPVIAVGEAFVTLECSVDSYTEYGANVTDACDPNVVVVIGGVVVDATVPGVYVVTYDATDSSGNVATQVSRTVTVQDTTAPVITLNGDGSQVIECPSPYVELGAIAADDCDQGLGLVVIDASEVDATTPGSYVVTYNISDASGNPAITVTRSVEVIDTTPPVISLLGDNPQVVEGSSSYIELGATASDTCDQALGPVVIDASSVNTAVPGFYSVTYDVSDANGNAAITVVRSVEVTDTTPPEITLLGVNPQLIECPGVYVELGATASDSHDQSLGAVLIDSSAVNIAVPGIYPVTYNISDASGNAASQVTRTVIVQDTTSPEISLVGTDPQLIECSSPYTELGATASDACDQALGAVVIDASGVDTTTPGDYVVTYNISDASGNAATQLTRTVTVRDTTPPVIVLLGDNPQLIECPSPYLELGATASDTCDLALGAVVIDASAVDTTTPGDYVVTYNIGDASGNAAVQLTRTVTVRDTTPPVVVLLGDNPQLIECPSPYVELGATASDTCDLALGAVVIDASAVDTTTPGDYVVTYNVSDASGNVATQLTRTVTVRDTTPPVIVLLGDNPQLIECPSPYVELSATASDTCDQALGAVVVDASAVDTTTPGDYVVTYNISDASGNTATQMTRTVRVQDTTPPVITLTGLAALTLECNVDTYGEEGATVSDTCDTTVTVIVGGDTVDPTHVGIYVVTYDSTDVSGNAAVQLTRTVSVVDTTAPVITLLGYNPETIECPDPYQEEGATASDLCDGDLTAEIVIDSSEVNSTVPGIYEVSYTAEDAAGNSTTEIREVEVVDTTVPVISLAGDASVVLLQGDIYVEEGATVTDSCDQIVSMVIDGDVVDPSVIGVYVVTYDSTDSSGNVATQVARTVTILPRFAALSALFGCADLKAEQDSLVNGSVGSTQRVDLHSQSEVTGDVVNVTGRVDVKSKAVVGGNIDAGGQVTVAKDASVGSSVISGEKIDLKKNASIGGDATSGGQVKLANGASVAGVITENAGVLPLTDIPLPVLALTTSGSNVTVKKNKSATVLPGGYKKLRGKEASTISLSSGHYTFSEIDVDKNSVIELDVSAGPITVDVVGKVDFDGIEMMLIGGGVTDVLFQVQGKSVKLGTSNAGGNGKSGKSGKSGSSKGAGASNKIGSYVGTYLAPNAQLTLEDGGVLNGTAYASKVHLKQDSVVNPEPALELLIAASTSWLGMESCVGTGGGSSGKSGKSGKSENSGSSKESGSGSEMSGKSDKDSGGKPAKSKGKRK